MSDQIFKATSSFSKGSVKKLLPVARMISGMDVKHALVTLEHINRACAIDFYKVLFSAISNAENNFNADTDSLVIKECYVNKSISLKRFLPSARGRAAKRVKKFSKIFIVLGSK